MLGPRAINKEKLDAEGQWSTNHIILGLSYDTASLTVTLPESKRAGARVLFDAVLLDRGSAKIGVDATRQIRGCMEHFKSTSAIWRLLTSPVDKLLSYADEIGEWITCPKKELCDNFRWSVYAIGGFMKTEEQWRRLFTGNMNRLLNPADRLSLKCEKGPFIWISTDATLDWASGISWGDKRCFRFKVSEIKDALCISPDTELGIGACEMLAALISIMIWSDYNGVKRHIILRTDNQNVLAWLSKNRTTDGFLNRILLSMIEHLLACNIEVRPRYIRSPHNHSADGLTMWADEEVALWIHNVRVECEAHPIERLQTIVGRMSRHMILGHLHSWG